MNPLIKIINYHVIDYPTPSNLSYWWNFGLLSAFCLGIQIITGILLAMNYTPHIDLAMASVEHIMRDIDYGWLIRYAHANGASMFFIMVYIHIARGLYYGSYITPKELPWCVGVVIFILMMATAFMGYKNIAQNDNIYKKTKVHIRRMFQSSPKCLRKNGI